MSADPHEHSLTVTETETGLLHHQGASCELTSRLMFFTVTQAEGPKPDWFPATFFLPAKNLLEEIHPLRGQALDLLNLEDGGKAYMEYI